MHRLFRKNRERMRYDSRRERGIRISSGIVESSCRHIVGLRLKHAGSHWTLKGANAVPAIKCAIANIRQAGFMDWKVGMSSTAKPTFLSCTQLVGYQFNMATFLHHNSGGWSELVKGVPIFQRLVGDSERRDAFAASNSFHRSLFNSVLPSSGMRPMQTEEKRSPSRMEITASSKEADTETADGGTPAFARTRSTGPKRRRTRLPISTAASLANPATSQGNRF